jgi:hypothetical protein
MSGGSFGYLFARVGDLQSNTLNALLLTSSEMQRWCAEHGQPEAAEELKQYVEFLGISIEGLTTRGEEISDLMHAIEWCASSDSGPDGIQRALKALKRE